MTTETQVKERPILFSGEMIRAILDGRKTQTRRVIKPQPEKWIDKYEPAVDPMFWIPSGAFIKDPSGIFGKGPLEVRQNRGSIKCPYGVPGDRLWVRETWRVHEGHNNLSPSLVAVAMNGDYVGCIDYLANPRTEDFWGKTRPSIHMPRWASRILLEVTDIRVERVQDISLEDAWAEGSTRDGFGTLWNSINEKKGFSWESNCWVWVVSFKEIKNDH